MDTFTLSSVLEGVAADCVDSLLSSRAASVRVRQS